MGVLSVIFGLLVMLGGIVGAAVYYMRNKQLTLGVIEGSGVASAIEFKPTVIKGQSIDEEQAKEVISLIQSLMDS